MSDKTFPPESWFDPDVLTFVEHKAKPPLRVHLWLQACAIDQRRGWILWALFSVLALLTAVISTFGWPPPDVFGVLAAVPMLLACLYGLERMTE